MDIIKRFRETVMSVKPPKDENVLWVDVSDSKNPLLKFYFLGKWVGLAGGGGGSTPVVPDLEVAYYYGALDYEVQTSSNINDVIINLNSSKKKSTSTNMNKEYHYIILYKDYKISSVITTNNENITEEFKNKGIVTMNGTEYCLYEFHLSNGLPLDVTANINITDS